MKKKEKKKQSKTKERKSDDDDDDDMEIVAFTETEKKMELLKGTRNFVLHMDSLKLHNSSRIVKRLRTYFNMEWNRVYGTIEKESDESVKDDEEKEENVQNKFDSANLPLEKDLGRKVPQQKNGCDCGVYVVCSSRIFKNKTHS